MLTCAQSLSCSKSKYLSFFSAGWVFRHAGMDVSIADRQNAYNMTLAVRGVVELFRIVKREKELRQEILAFLSRTIPGQRGSTATTL